MKKKIMIFMLLLSFLVGVGVPKQVKADDSTEIILDDVKYRDIEDYMHSNGYVFTKKDNCYYVVVFDNFFSNLMVMELYYPHDDAGIFLARDTTYNNLWFFTSELYSAEDCTEYIFHSPDKAVSNNKFDSVSSRTASYRDSFNYNGVNKIISYISLGSSVSSDVLYSDFDIYEIDRRMAGSNVHFDKSTDRIFFTSNCIGPYSFILWCSDAGLSCAASSNETEDLYDFTFNSEDYHYIVRRNRIAGSKYTLFLSQVTKEEDLIYYSTNRAMADSKIGAAALYVLSGEYASGNTNICNYVYDSSGGGWLYTDNYGVDLGLTNDYFVDDIGISFSSSMPIVYSSTDIYSDKEQSSVYYAADTEFEDPFVVYPNISPTSTPTPTPISNSGSSDLGGNVVAGGGIDFIISIVSQFWSRVCSIPMYVDGFQINLQQMYVYGILAGIVGGAIVLFTRRK